METQWLDGLFQTRPPFKVALDPFRPRSQVDASFTVRAKATYYPYLAKVFVPKTPWRKLEPDMVAHAKLTRKQKNKTQSEDDQTRSLRRTKSAVRDYVLCNRFELFCTFTFKDDRGDIDKCRAKMSGWLNRQQKRQGKFSYLIVAEFHPKALAEGRHELHFHALFKDYQGELKLATNPHTGKPIYKNGKPVYNLVGYKLGHTTAQKIGDTGLDYAKVASYVIKEYITKDMPLFFGKNRYWHSQKLVKPKVEYNPSGWFLHHKPDKVYESANGTTYLFLNNYVASPQYRFELFKVQALPGLEA